MRLCLSRAKLQRQRSSVSLLDQRLAKLDLESLYRNADVVRMVQECTVEVKTMRNEMASDEDGKWRRERNYGRRLRGSVDSLKRLSTILPCPSKRRLPAITYQFVPGALFILDRQERSSSVRRRRVQIDAWAEDYSVAEDLGDDIEAAMLGSDIEYFIIDRAEFFDTISAYHRTMIQYRIWFS